MLENNTELAQVLWPAQDKPVTKAVRCRHCNKPNRVQVRVAALEPERCECGSCRKPLFLGPNEPLVGLSSSCFEHALDRLSLDALRALPGFPALIRWVLSTFVDRVIKLECLASNIQCGPDQFPELVSLLDEARARLDVMARPALYLREAATMNAMIGGVDEPSIILFAALLDQFSDAEITAVLGHELGHLNAGHTQYHLLAVLLTEGGLFVGGIGRLATLPVRKALANWRRCSELTADRAGLLACRDLAVALSVFLKFAGGNRPGTMGRTRIQLPAFVRQARSLAELESNSWLDGAIAALQTMDASHPFTAWRLMHLLQWVETGNYLDIMAGNYRQEERKVPAA